MTPAFWLGGVGTRITVSRAIAERWMDHVCAARLARRVQRPQLFEDCLEIASSDRRSRLSSVRKEHE